MIYDVVDLAAARRWGELALAALAAVRGELDRANVFPVPDADTGSNLYLTFRDALAWADDGPAASGGESDAGTYLAKLADGALEGARGNSGTILAEYLAGFASVAGPWGATDLARCYAAAARAARAAVADPMPGTILSAADAAADAVAVAAKAVGAGTVPGASVLGAAVLGAAVSGAASGAGAHTIAGVPSVTGDRSATRSVRTVADRAAAAAWAAVEHSDLELAALGNAGVLDAGAAGLWVILDALRRALGGAGDVPELHLVRRGGGGRAAGPAAGLSEAAGMMGRMDAQRPDSGRADSVRSDSVRSDSRSPDSGRLDRPDAALYEVVYTFRGTRELAARLRARLVERCESVVVAGGTGVRPVTDTMAPATVAKDAAGTPDATAILGTAADLDATEISGATVVSTVTVVPAVTVVSAVTAIPETTAGVAKGDPVTRWRVHVHTDDPASGIAIPGELGVTAENLRVCRMAPEATMASADTFGRHAEQGFQGALTPARRVGQIPHPLLHNTSSQADDRGVSKPGPESACTHGPQGGLP